MTGTIWNAYVDSDLWEIEEASLDAARQYVEEALYERKCDAYHEGIREWDVDVEFVEIDLETDAELRRVKESMSVDLEPEWTSADEYRFQISNNA